MKRRAVIQAIGHAVPDRVMTNDEISTLVDTTDEWIVQRTGIRERRICGPNELASTLSVRASREALERAGMSGEEIDLVAVGTVTGDMHFPSTAAIVQKQIGAGHAGAYDLGAACAGFIYSLATAAAMVENGAIDTALVIGVDVLSRFADWTDRSTCILFGDGAGAVVLKGEVSERGVLKTVLRSDGGGAEHIRLEVGGSWHPVGHPDSANYNPYIYMNGREVYRFAVTAMGDACMSVLHEAGLETKDIDLFVPHQANLRIIESAAKRLDLPEDKVFVNVDRYGNTSAGSIPLGLYEAEAQGRLRKGMVVLTVGFGAGLVWGANVIRW